jgi:hypothetical protein
VVRRTNSRSAIARFVSPLPKRTATSPLSAAQRATGATLAAGLETRCESQHELDHIAISIVSRVGLRGDPRIHGDIKHPHPEQFGTGASASGVTDRG